MMSPKPVTRITGTEGSSLDFHATQRTNILGRASDDFEPEPAAIPPRDGRALVEQARGNEEGIVRTPGQLHDHLGRRHVPLRRTVQEPTPDLARLRALEAAQLQGQ